MTAQRLRTTVRLDQRLQDALDVASEARGVTRDSLISEALIAWLRNEKYLHFRKYPESRVFEASTIDDALAELALQWCPAPCVIKDLTGKIVWGNCAMEEVVGKNLALLKNQTMENAGIVTGFLAETLKKNIQTVVSSGKSQVYREDMRLLDGYAIVKAIRFLFSVGSDQYIGDISFVERHISESHTYRNVFAPLKNRICERYEAEGQLLIEFLKAMPVAFALKRPIKGEQNSTIVFSNGTYNQLAGISSAEQRSTRDIFNLPAGHAITENDYRVVSQGQARFCRETIPTKTERWTLRYPIFDANGNVELIAAVSPDFQLESSS